VAFEIRAGRASPRLCPPLVEKDSPKDHTTTSAIGDLFSRVN